MIARTHDYSILSYQACYSNAKHNIFYNFGMNSSMWSQPKHMIISTSVGMKSSMRSQHKHKDYINVSRVIWLLNRVQCLMYLNRNSAFKTETKPLVIFFKNTFISMVLTKIGKMPKVCTLWSLVSVLYTYWECDRFHSYLSIS